MGYWQSTVLPKIKKVFEKNSAKKAAAAEACKSFDDSKEEYSKEFEEKKTELQPKVIEIYEAAAIEIKTLVKEPKATGLKKHSSSIAKFLDELAKLEFPGSKPAYEATTKFGATYVGEPIFFVFKKVSTLIPTEVGREVEVPAPETTAATTITEEISGTEEKEIVGEVEKKVEAVAAPVEPEKTETVVAALPKMEEPKA